MPTLGAGASYQGRRWTFAVHAGLNRLDLPYQFRQIDAPPAPGSPARPTTVLDRQHFVQSVKLTRVLGEGGSRVSLYGETHEVGEASTVSTTGAPEHLPDDHGFLLGTQVHLARAAHFADLFVRGATGLATASLLTAPSTVGADVRAADAREFVLGTDGALEGRRLGLLLGAYLRYFRAANPDAGNPSGHFWEGIVAARPHLFWYRYLWSAAEVSYQQRSPATADPARGMDLDAEVLKLTAMPAVVNLEPGLLGRPQLRVLYSASLLSQGARAQLGPLDTRYGRDVVHYLGAQVEWWFNGDY